MAHRARHSAGWPFIWVAKVFLLVPNQDSHTTRFQMS
jgi:hypothetical protein